MLEFNFFQRGTAHGVHLTKAAVGVVVISADQVLNLRAHTQALAHRLAVLHHAGGTKLTGLFMAGAWGTEVCLGEERVC